MTRRPKTIFRPLDGILLLDKPQGMSSNQALQRARHIFRAEKGGHTGSLDPLATGLLPLCFGEATKIAGLLLGARKAYETVAVLGSTTDTDDADGVLLRQRDVPAIDAATLDAALQVLRGSIQQRAPIYSALKQGGEPLYVKARRGDVIEAPVREVEVHAIQVLEQQPDRISLRVECGSGTYIRSLVRDLGQTLGCGAHVGALRRLWVQPFRQPRMFGLEELEALTEQGDTALDACLLPIEAGLSDFPAVHLDAGQALQLGHGQTVQLSEPARLAESEQEAGLVVVFDEQRRCLGLGQIQAGRRLTPQRLFRWAVSALKPEQADGAG